MYSKGIAPAHRFELVEGKRFHCGQMARLMREAHTGALVRLGIVPHRQLYECFSGSWYCKAWLIDGMLAGIGGVEGPLISGTGYVWLALAQWASTGFPRATYREAKRQLTIMMDTRQELTTNILGADSASLHFARRLGFRVESPIPLEIDSVYQLKKDRNLQSNRKVGPTPPFIIYTAGRSRTAWLSAFLTYGDYLCHNEIAIKFRNIAEVTAFFARPNIGTAETAVAPAWRLIEKIAPGIRTVVVRRDVESIIASFARSEIAEIATIDEDRLRQIITYEERCLEQISARPGVLTVEFSELTKAYTAKKIFEHCLPYEFDFEWWEYMNARNIQTSVRELFSYYQTNKEDIEDFKYTAKRFLIGLVRSGELTSHAIG